MVTLKRRASNLFPYDHLYSSIHSVDCTAQFRCPTTEVYTFIYYFALNKNQWLCHYTCSGFCKTSSHLLISPPPTNLPNTWKIHTGENKIDCQGRQCTCYFPANGSTNPDVFQPKTFSIPRGIIPQNFSQLGLAVAEELGN